LFSRCYCAWWILVVCFREPDAAVIVGCTRGLFFSFFVVALGIGFIVVAKRRPTYPRKLSA
jgi:prolipoprotein diacylglyceryltransferase